MCSHLCYQPNRHLKMHVAPRMIVDEEQDHDHIFHKDSARSRLTAFQCSVVGRCMNWESFPITNAMSSQVRERYYRLPTIVWYSVEFDSVAPVWRSSVGTVASGVMTGLALVMRVRARRTVMHRHWDKVAHVGKEWLRHPGRKRAEDLSGRIVGQ